MTDGDFLELSQLQAALKEGLEELFPSRVWVRAEIASVSVKANGHCYLDLCENDGSSLVARAKAVIWRSRYQQMLPKLQEELDGELRPGMEILARVQVNYSEIYGLTLVIDSIEPRLTLGQAELERRRTMRRLADAGLLDAQQALRLPGLPLSLAVVSAPTAAGFGDFMRHLGENPYGFAFDVSLFEAVMQGAAAPESVSDAIQRAEAAGGFDALLILRGGGSAQDLACFDDYGLCVSIASCKIPVFTAIGHDRDTHIADLVAFRAVKTPTALADEFIGAIAAEDERLCSYLTRFRLAFSERIAEAERKLELLSGRIQSADPRKVLERGYTLVTDSGGVVLKEVRGLSAGSRLTILFSDGSAACTVNHINISDYGKI